MPEADDSPADDPIETALDEANRAQAGAIADALAPLTSPSTPIIEMLAPGLLGRIELLGRIKAARENVAEPGPTEETPSVPASGSQMAKLTPGRLEWAVLVLDVINKHEPKWRSFADAHRDNRLRDAIDEAGMSTEPDAAVRGAQRALEGLGEDTRGQGHRFIEMLKKHESVIRVRHANLSGPTSTD